MWNAGSGIGPPENPLGLIAFVIMVAFLEVSNIPYRTMKSLRLSPRTLAVLVVFGGACLAVGAVYDISTVLVLLGMHRQPVEVQAVGPDLSLGHRDQGSRRRGGGDLLEEAIHGLHPVR